ncbi:hypothetical protein [Nitrosopumilus sp.]|uniref:hypothetical protein n=1 Tax=Nitrosopumilus sp. TaxID=2024843 RepID=UPI00247D3176|nr:hypothetical protein [Nitrosopumilus sp.]MCV0409473.1 hypothetical protein [Nitrosopumilus sp.]
MEFTVVNSKPVVYSHPFSENTQAYKIDPIYIENPNTGEMVLDIDSMQQVLAVLESCANDSPQERMANPLRYTNDTHVLLNLGCEWKSVGKYLGVENEN